MAVENWSKDITFDVETSLSPEELEERICAILHEPDTPLAAILGAPFDGSVDPRGFHLTRNRFRLPSVAFAGKFISDGRTTRVRVTGMTKESGMALRFGPYVIILPIVLAFAAVTIVRQPGGGRWYLWLLALFIPWWLGSFARWRLAIAFEEDRAYLTDLLTGRTDGHRKTWWEKRREERRTPEVAPGATID